MKRDPKHGVVTREKEAVKNVLKNIRQPKDKMEIIEPLAGLYDEICNTREERKAFVAIIASSFILKNSSGWWQLLLPKTADVLEGLEKTKDTTLLFPIDGIGGSIEMVNREGHTVKYLFLHSMDKNSVE